MKDGKEITFYVQVRPKLETFLNEVNELYDIVIYGNNSSNYLNSLIKSIDPYEWSNKTLSIDKNNEDFISNFIKFNGCRDNLIIIDSDESIWKKYPTNAIPIKSWNGDDSDRDLEKLIPLLEILSKERNIEEYLGQILKQYEIDKTYPKCINKLLEKRKSYSRNEEPFHNKSLSSETTQKPKEEKPKEPINIPKSINLKYVAKVNVPNKNINVLNNLIKKKNTKDIPPISAKPKVKFEISLGIYYF